MVGDVGLEPTTPCSQSTCASQLRQSPKADNREKQIDKFLGYRLGLLSFDYQFFGMVGVPGVEPGTSTLSVSRSNQLSYTPQ
jgi:hypothetical protein